jgi:hypothetical protein
MYQGCVEGNQRLRFKRQTPRNKSPNIEYRAIEISLTFIV